MKFNSALLITSTLFCTALSQLQSLEVYASYRNTTNQTPASAVTFNSEDINVGGGITPNASSATQFTINVTGDYQINFGVDSLLPNSAFVIGYNLTLTRGGSTTTLHNFSYPSTSSSVIVSLMTGDIISVNAQVPANVTAPLTATVTNGSITTETYTSFITFLLVGNGSSSTINARSLY